jgi:hypothetical protein
MPPHTGLRVAPEQSAKLTTAPYPLCQEGVKALRLNIRYILTACHMDEAYVVTRLLQML